MFHGIAIKQCYAGHATQAGMVAAQCGASAYASKYDFDVKNPQTTNKIFEQIQTAFLQDVAVFSAQQRNLTLIRNPPQIDIAADAGAIQARRILARLYDEEQAAARGAAAE
jgi:hypothetical protein